MTSDTTKGRKHVLSAQIQNELTIERVALGDNYCSSKTNEEYAGAQDY